MSDEQQQSHRYADADQELADYFTSSLGVRAQSYTSGGGAFDSDAAHEQKVSAMRRKNGVEWFDRVAQTVVSLPDQARRVLESVYAPHGWPLDVASELSSPWPKESPRSLVALAAALPQASRAAGGQPVVEWLSMRLERIAHIELEKNRREAKAAADVLLANLRDAAEEQRLEALAVYDVLRISRRKAEARARWEGMSTEQRKAERLRRKDAEEQAALRGLSDSRVAVALTGAHEARLAEVCAVVGEAMGVDRRAA